MFSGNDSLTTAVQTAKEQDLKPLVKESAETLGLDRRQVAEMEAHLDEAWFIGIRTGHRVMMETKMGGTELSPPITSMQDEFQDLMERLGDALNTTVGATIQAWDYLGQAWIAGTRFWEVEIAARLIESQGDGFDGVLRRLDEAD